MRKASSKKALTIPQLTSKAFECGRKVAHKDYGSPTAYTKPFDELEPSGQKGMIALVRYVVGAVKKGQL